MCGAAGARERVLAPAGSGHAQVFEDMSPQKGLRYWRTGDGNVVGRSCLWAAMRSPIFL